MFSKITKLYNIFFRNVLTLFLFGFFLINASFIDNDDKTENVIRTIVIDPGHGGKDSGTMGTKRFKVYEKHVALDVSIKLGEYIKSEFPNVNVIYTRKNDVFLKLNERTEIANRSNADLFISIHCDGFTNPNPSGASVFVMGMSKLKENMDVAMRENAAIYLEDNYKKTYDGFDPKSPESYIVFSLMQNTYLNQSLIFAEEVEKEFSTRAKRKSRGVKQAPFYVISRTNMPSVLIECGFLTNPKEEEYLHSKSGQDYIASAIFRAFKKYKLSFEENKDTSKFITKATKNNNLELLNDKRENKILYKVQIGTYLKSMVNDFSFKKFKCEEIFSNGTFKYYVGSFIDKTQADILKNDMRKTGFQGAFVVAFYKDKRISIKEALDLQMKINNYE